MRWPGKERKTMTRTPKAKTAPTNGGSSVHELSETEARTHHEQVITIPAGTQPAPDVQADGRRTALTSAADDLDRLRGEMIGMAIAKDADGRLEGLVAAREAQITVRDQVRDELAEAELVDARSAATADYVERARGMSSAKRARVPKVAVALVLGILALAEAALAYPGFRYALPAPRTDGLMGVLLPLLPACAALAVALGCAVAQKLVGMELAKSHRGLIAEPPASNDARA
jgi:hypothetical protein